jgi:hypothetical protein
MISAKPISDDIDHKDVNDGCVNTTSPQLIAHAIVDIDQNVGARIPIGEILLRR